MTMDSTTHVDDYKALSREDKSRHLRDNHGRAYDHEWRRRILNGYGYEFAEWHQALHYRPGEQHVTACVAMVAGAKIGAPDVPCGEPPDSPWHVNPDDSRAIDHEYRAPDWYRRTMLNGSPIPAGVTIDEDYRAEQSCETCGELVDAFGPTFTDQRCSQHVAQ